MPIALHHGHASPAWIDAVIQDLQIKASACSTRELIYFVAGNKSADVQAWQSRISLALAPGVVSKISCLTFDELCYTVVKTHVPRTHRLDAFCGQYIMATILAEHEKDTTPAWIIEKSRELWQTYVTLKESGLTHENIRQHVGASFKKDHYLKVCRHYDAFVKEIYHRDVGDVILNTLELIENKNTLPANAAHIVIGGLYPFRPAERQLLRLIRQHFPRFPVTLFYSQSGKPQDNLLGLAYEELGEIADSTHWIDNPPLTPLTMMNFASDFRMADYLNASCNRNAARIISSRMDFLTLLPCSQNLAEEIGAYASCNVPWSITLAPARTAARARQRARELKDNLIFYDHLLAHNKMDLCLPTGDRRRMIMDALITTASFMPEPSSPLGPNTCTLNTYSVFDAHPAYFCDAHWESLVPEQDVRIIHNDIMHDSRLEESLCTPAYTALIHQERLRQAACFNPQFKLLSASASCDGRKVTPLNKAFFNQDVSVIFPATEQRASKMPSAQRHYAKTKKHSFSVGELQTYLDCPFKYHARYHLKLEDKTASLLEILPSERGTFVHTVLHKLIGGQQTRYLEGLEFARYRNEVVKSIRPLVMAEAHTAKLYDKFSHALVDELLDRLVTTLTQLVNNEGTFFHEQQKLTMPKYCEWSFGGNTKALEIKIGKTVLQISGRIDRIDTYPPRRAYTLIDYKTGEPPTTKSIRDGTALQLGLYSLAVEGLLLPGHRLAAAVHYDLRRLSIKGIAVKDFADKGIVSRQSLISEDDVQAMQKAVAHHVEGIFTGMQEGDFNPNPRDVKKCPSCSYRHFCGKAPAITNTEEAA